MHTGKSKRLIPGPFRLPHHSYSFLNFFEDNIKRKKTKEKQRNTNVENTPRRQGSVIKITILELEFKFFITSTNLTKALHTYTAPTLLPPTPTPTPLASAHTEIGHRRYIYIPLLRPPYSTDPTGENNSCSPLPTQDGKSLATNFARLNTSSAANRISEPPYNTKCQVKHVIMCTTPNTYESQHWLHTPHISTSPKNCQPNVGSRYPSEHHHLEGPPYPTYSNAHWFSLRTSSSSSGVKSFLMLNVFRISSGVFPLIMSATVWQVRSSRFLMFK
jgi:hypothetical protein